MYSQSIHNVEYRADNGGDKYLRLGQSVLVRKFDPALINSASWNELWIGFRWRFDTAYDWLQQSGSGRITVDSGQFYVGPCATSGKVYGELDTSSYGHFVAYAMDNATVFSGVTEMRFDYSGGIDLGYTQSVMLGNTSLIGYHNGIRSNPVAQTYNLTINRGSAAHPNRGISIFRFSSSLQETWSYSSVMMYFPNVNSYNDKTSSAILGEMFKSTDWNGLTARLGSAAIWDSSASYVAVTRTNEIPSPRSLYGYFDGMFISYNQYYDRLNISDVVVRAI